VGTAERDPFGNRIGFEMRFMSEAISKLDMVVFAPRVSVI